MNALDARYLHGAEHAAQRALWAAGKINCPLCTRFGCKGQCECTCDACARGLKERLEGEAIPFCDIIRRAKMSPEERAAAHRADEAKKQGGEPWGECIAQVERLGVPHLTARAAKKPLPNASIAGVKHWETKRAERPFLVLLGGPGVGKSVAAAYAMARWGEARPWWRDRATGSNPRPVVWLSAPEVGRLPFLRENDEGYLREARVAELLVVDDLEAEGGPGGIRALASLLQHRADNARPTVITGNLETDALRRTYGDHLADRMRRCAMAPGVSGKSLRGKP